MNTPEVPDLKQLLERLHLAPEGTTFVDLLVLRLQEVAVDQQYDQHPHRALQYSSIDNVQVMDVTVWQ